MNSAAPAADAGPNLRLSTRGLGFSPGRPGAENPETPEQAVSALALLDVANHGRRFHVPADRMPGSTLLVGPLADDGDGNQHVLCWHRHGPGVTAERPGVVSLVVVPVDHKREGLTGEQWRQRMLFEAQREDHPRWGRLHFWQTRAVADFRALPHVLVETFGRDGEGWASFADWFLDHCPNATFAPGMRSRAVAITADDKRNVALSFNGSWRARDHLTVWEDAWRGYLRRFPASSLSLGEFQQLCDMRGLTPVAVGGGADRPHDVRLSIGTG